MEMFYIPLLNIIDSSYDPAHIMHSILCATTIRDYVHIKVLYAVDVVCRIIISLVTEKNETNLKTAISAFHFVLVAQ